MDRRTVLKGGLVLAATSHSAAGVVADLTTAQERADYHWNAYVEAMNQLTAGFDGWLINGGARYSEARGARTNFRNLNSVSLSMRDGPTKILIERHSPLKI